MMRLAIRVILIICGFMLSGCDNHADYTPEAGLWRASVTVPGGELPFHIEFSSEGDLQSAVLINGEERVSVQEVSFTQDRLILRLPAFNSTIQGKLQGNQIEGTLTLVKGGGNEQIMPFLATSAKASRFPESTAAAGVDLRRALAGLIC